MLSQRPPHNTLAATCRAHPTPERCATPQTTTEPRNHDCEYKPRKHDGRKEQPLRGHHAFS
eukprot:1898306-Lingulodinium_polyedra.AAC.1